VSLAKRIGAAITDIGGTGTMTVLAGIGGFLYFVLVIGARYAITGEPPSEGWAIPLGSCAAFSGVGAALKVGHRATTKPEVIREEAEAEAKKVVAVAKADVMRKSGAVPVVPDAAPLRGDVP
jgi:hypothetical protein